MELRQLRYLVVVARHEHFTRAASELHVAQSALSQQVRRLERELGVELLVRDRRGVRPTPAGELLLGRAQRILAEVDGALGDLEELRGVVGGRVEIGAIPPLTPLDVPELLAAFHERHPAIDVRLREGTAHETFALLRADALDAGFALLGEHELPPQVASVPAGREELVVVCAPTHALAALPAVELGALGGEELVTFRPGSALRGAVDDALAAAGAAPRVAFESNDGPTNRALAARGLGVGLLPRSFVEGPGPAVAVRPVAPERLWRPLSLVWRAARHHPPAARAFLAFAREVLAAPSAGR